MKQPLLALLSLTLTLPACGSVGPGEDPAADGGDDSVDPDHRTDADDRPDAGDEPAAEVPSVVTVTPADGARGVAPDAKIEIVFSHPMDAASVMAAWSSDDLPATDAAFSWNQAGDVLTITPDDPWPLAEGTGLDPDVVKPIPIAFVIGEDARDQEGTALAEPLAIQFRTARRMTVTLGYDISLSDCRTKSGSAAWSDDTLYAGDTYSNSSIRMVMSFALPQLPAGAALEQANVSGTQTTSAAGMYKFFGSMTAVHVRFDSVGDAYDAISRGTLGTFSSSGLAGLRSIAATSAVADDLADGVSHAQFRMQFARTTDLDGLSDLAQFSRSSLRLILTYLVE